MSTPETKDPVGGAVVSSAAPVPRVLVDIDYNRLQTITRHVQLVDVSLFSFNFVSQADPREVRDQDRAMPEYQIHVVDARWFRKDTHFEITLGYDVLASLLIEGLTQKPPLFRLRTTWVVTYSLPETFERPEKHEDAAADFVFANGQINVFPFLRQLVLDVTGKGGWPPLLLPVFKIPRNRPADIVRNLPAFAQPQPSTENDGKTTKIE